MNKNAIGMMVAMAMGLCSALPVLAAEGASMAERDMPGVAVGGSRVVMATVEAINHATREVALRYPDGSIEVFVAGDEVRNLAQVEVGDVVKLEIKIGLMLSLQPAGDGIRERGDKLEAERAEPGQKPSATIRKTVHARGVVRAVDMKARTVTLQGALQTVTLPVSEDIDLNKVKVGDTVNAEYVESLAISVQPAAAKP